MSIPPEGLHFSVPITPELRAILDAPHNWNQPTPECLNEEESNALMNGAALTEKQKEHAKQCEHCMTGLQMIAMARRHIEKEG